MASKAKGRRRKVNVDYEIKKESLNEFIETILQMEAKFTKEDYEGHGGESQTNLDRVTRSVYHTP